MLSTGFCAQLACVWEATARKPGNVHRERDFDDLGYLDFLLSAAAIAPVLDTAEARSVGETILQGIRATRRVVRTNTNLGILLLLAPLATAGQNPRTDVESVLAKLDVADARATYEAIHLAVPGGLGRVEDQDILVEPTRTLRQVMQLAAERDLIAQQYVNGFREVFEDGVPALQLALERFEELETAIIWCHLHFMARHPDSLIARKRGQVEADQAAGRAREVLEAGWPRDPAGCCLLAQLDAWLRAEGNARNPGTTADLVTACLFIALREGILTLPSPYPWSAGLHHA